MGRPIPNWKNNNPPRYDSYEGLCGFCHHPHVCLMLKMGIKVRDNLEVFHYMLCCINCNDFFKFEGGETTEATINFQ
jgi:hypothetical protein